MLRGFSILKDLEALDSIMIRRFLQAVELKLPRQDS